MNTVLPIESSLFYLMSKCSYQKIHIAFVCPILFSPFPLTIHVLSCSGVVLQALFVYVHAYLFWFASWSASSYR